MPTPALAISVALSMAFEIEADATGTVPSIAHILPPGPFRAVDGRPDDCVAWQLDDAIAAQVIARQAGKKNDTLIDYEHQSLRAEWNGQPVLAAGWFKPLQWQPATGLYAIDIAWTDVAKARILSKEYRYISAVFTYLSGTGEILEIISIALTNTPAIDGLDALAELTKKLNSTPGGIMTAEKIAALTLERDTATAKLAALTEQVTQKDQTIAALTAENTGLASKVLAAEQATAALAATVDADKKTQLITEALSTGKLVPSLKAWAEGKSLADLTEYFAAAPTINLVDLQHKQHQENGADGLTAEELAMCTRMGVTPEDFKKAK